MDELLAGADDAVALIEARTGRTLTYRALRAAVADAAAALRPGLAFVFARNDVDSVVALLGALAAGVPVALFDARLDELRAGALIERYQPETIVGRAAAAGGGGAAPHPELALLLTTSGATGSPKLVRLTRAALLANARAIALGLALTAGEVAPTSLPLHYAYGLSVVTSHLAAGATVLLTDDALTSDDFWAACRAHGATSLAGVPYSYQVLRRLDLDRVAPPSLRTLTQAGGKLATALVDRFAALARARHGGLYVMYGQTEATARMAIATPEDLVERPGTVGKPIAGGRVSIEDGEIVFHGPSVMMGYAHARADLARGDELHGVLRTGDLGHLDDDGYLYVTGRAKRIAKVYGLRLNLDELEAALGPRVEPLALAVIGDDERLTVLVEHGDDAALIEVKRVLLAHTGLHASGVVVITTAALPRLASGKIDYSALASR